MVRPIVRLGRPRVSALAQCSVRREGGPKAEFVARSNSPVGCYCETETRCHRSVLRALLHERGARLAEP